MRASLIQCSRVTISLTDRSSSPCRSSLRSGNVSGSIVSILVPLRDRGDSGDVFPHSEPRGGQRQEGNAGGQVNRAAAGRVLQWGVWVLGNTAPQAVTMISSEVAHGMEPVWLPRLVLPAACRGRCDLSLLWERLPYFYGSRLLLTPELNALNLRSKWWISPLFHYLAYPSFHILLGVWLLGQTWWHPTKMSRKKVINSLCFQEKHPC